MKNFLTVIFVLVLICYIGLNYYKFVRKYLKRIDYDSRASGYTNYRQMKFFEEKNDKKTVKRVVREKNKRIMSNIDNIIMGGDYNSSSSKKNKTYSSNNINRRNSTANYKHNGRKRRNKNY